MSIENDNRKPIAPNAAAYGGEDQLTGLYHNTAGNLEMRRDGVDTIEFYSTHTLFKQAIVVSDNNVEDIELKDGEALLFIKDGRLTIKDGCGTRGVVMQNERSRIGETDTIRSSISALDKCLADNINQQEIDFNKINDKIKRLTKEINDIDSTLDSKIDNKLHDIESALSNLETRASEMLNNAIEIKDKSDVDNHITEIEHKLRDNKTELNNNLETKLRDIETEIKDKSEFDLAKINNCITEIKDNLRNNETQLHKRVELVETELRNKIKDKSEVDLAKIDNSITEIKDKLRNNETQLHKRVELVETELRNKIKDKSEVDLAKIDNCITEIKDKSEVDLTKINILITELNNRFEPVENIYGQIPLSNAVVTDLEIMDDMFIKVADNSIYVEIFGERSDAIVIPDVKIFLKLFMIDDLCIAVANSLDNKTLVYIYEICGTRLERLTKYKLNIFNVVSVALQKNYLSILGNQHVIITLDYSRIDKVEYVTKN